MKNAHHEGFKRHPWSWVADNRIRRPVAFLEYGPIVLVVLHSLTDEWLI